jgi:glutathione S-transferase
MYQLHYAPDNASLIVRLVLEELGVAYETVLVDRSLRTHKSPSYLALNPQGMIPVLVTPDGPMFETGAILLRLSERHEAMAPPVNDSERADFLKWLFFVANGFHGELRQLFYPELYIGADEKMQSLHFNRAKTRLMGQLGMLESLYAEGRSWLDPAKPSVLNYYVAGCLRFITLYPQSRCEWFALGQYRALQASVTALEARPAVLAACAAEGLGLTPFSAPTYACPPEGSAVG